MSYKKLWEKMMKQEQINTAIKAVYEEIDLIELTAKYRF